MILQNEIKQKATAWKVPPDTVDKDYVLGHFLALFSKQFKSQLVFKGGTCLRKCYFPNYRFSEDLDFTAVDEDFVLEKSELRAIADKLKNKVRILLNIGEIKIMQHQDEPKGYQVKLKYWGANHSINTPPPSPQRWMTNIKLEISTDEKILTEVEEKEIIHQYSDELLHSKVNCYSLDEVVAEKLRVLKQRSYTAPRDIYDLYNLTKDFSEKDWKSIKPLFEQKMKAKGLEIESSSELVSEENLQHISKAWDGSIKHQLVLDYAPKKEEIINSVVKNIKQHL
jgi:predicted nucleotidyltransferase component of viral defense system